MEDFQTQKLLADIESIAKSLETIANQMVAAAEMRAKKSANSNNHFDRDRGHDRKKFNKPYNKPNYNSNK